MELEITSLHQEQYERDGYTIVRSGFTTDECDRFVANMVARLFRRRVPLYADPLNNSGG